MYLVKKTYMCDMCEGEMRAKPLGVPYKQEVMGVRLLEFICNEWVACCSVCSYAKRLKQNPTTQEGRHNQFTFINGEG